MSSLMFPAYAQVYVRLARFVGTRLHREPRPSLDVEEVITAAYRRIDEQDVAIKALSTRNNLQDIEIEHLESELDWLCAVLKKAHITLSDYDYMRLQQVAVKVRVVRPTSLAQQSHQ